MRDTVIAALAIGDVDTARRTIEASNDPRPYMAASRRLASALLHEAEGNLETAAAEFEWAARELEPLATQHHAHALLGQGRCLVALGRGEQAVAPLDGARDLARQMSATPWLAEADALLAGIEAPARGSPTGT